MNFKTKQNNLYLLGAPGAGKGTQAQKLSSVLAIPQISTGDMLREIRRQDSDLAKQVAGIMDSGALVPDEIVIELVRLRLQRPDCESGVVLDGFPRTEVQAEALDALFQQEGRMPLRVILIDVLERDLVARLVGRLVCAGCGRSFHKVHYPPSREGICDGCGGTLVSRSDDQPEVIQARLRAYQEQTAPLIEYYQKKGTLTVLDGSKDAADVFEKLLDGLGVTGV